MNYRLILLLSGLLLMYSACKKTDSSPTEENGVTIVLIDRFETLEDSKAILTSSVELASRPLIFYRDILAYDQEAHTFQLSGEAVEAMEGLPNDGHQSAFAVLVEGEIIYTAYFWAAYSSASCDWTVADPLIVKSRQEMTISLGYAVQDGASIPDLRNDPRIIDVLARDNKLV